MTKHEYLWTKLWIQAYQTEMIWWRESIAGWKPKESSSYWSVLSLPPLIGINSTWRALCSGKKQVPSCIDYQCPMESAHHRIILSQRYRMDGNSWYVIVAQDMWVWRDLTLWSQGTVASSACSATAFRLVAETLLLLGWLSRPAQHDNEWKNSQANVTQ